MTLPDTPIFSIVVPTRGRPDSLRRLLDSFKVTTTRLETVEIILVIDADDSKTVEFVYDEFPVKRVVVHPSLTMGALNMTGYEISSGKYIMLLNDDVIVRTRGWDEKVLAAFRMYADEIVLVHVNDKIFEEKLCTFPFLSRTYCELAGGICPPDYVRYRIDDHIYSVFNLLAVLGKVRILYLPDVVFEHTNFVLNGSNLAEYRPNERIHGIDTKRFNELLPERKTLALRLMDHIDRWSASDRSRVRESLLNQVTDSVALRRPEYIKLWSDGKSLSAENTRVTIGVVSANLKSDHARTCIDLIKKFTDNVDLIVLDNNRKSTFNHSHEMNKLLSICDTEFLVLMDDDVFVEPGWLDGILRCVEPSVGVVTPLHKDALGNLSYAGVVMRPDYSGHHSHSLIAPGRPSRIQTLCTAIILIDMSKCGNIRFDESYSKYFLDIDYGLRIWSSGYEVVCSPYTSVTHIGGATLQQGSPVSKDLFEIQRQHFVRDWVETGRYRRLEQEAWQKIPEIQSLLILSSGVDALIKQPPDEDRELFRNRALTLFRCIKNYPTLGHWASQRLFDALGTIRPTVDDPEMGHLAFLLGCLPHPVLIEEGFNDFNIILYNTDFYAIPQTEGGFDFGRFVRGEYTRRYCAESIIVLKARICGDTREAEIAALSVKILSQTPTLIDQNDNGLNIIFVDAEYYAIPQGEGAFDMSRFTRGEYSRGYKSNTLEELKCQITAHASQSQEIVLVEEGFDGLNMVRLNDAYYAIPQAEGAFDISRFTRGEYSRGYKSNTLEELKCQITAHASQSQEIVLVEEGFNGLNIVRLSDAYYAIPQGEGVFDLGRLERGEYSRSYRANSIEALKAQICSDPPIKFWQAVRNERLRAGSWRSAIKPVTKRVLKATAARSIGAGTLVRMKRAGVKNLVQLQGQNRPANVPSANPQRWLNASPITLVEPEYRGYSIYRYEYKFFAVPQSAGTFSYQNFKQGKYDLCLIRHSLSEVHAAVDALLHSKPGSIARRNLVFGSLTREQLKPLLERVYTDQSITLLVDKAASNEWPDYDKILLEDGSLMDWARSQDSTTSDRATDRLQTEKFDRIIIPWSFPETFADNSLEVAAAKVSSCVEVLHASGERRVYDGENLHRLIYNKAYLASMFQVVPSVEGKTVLEAGCSDGLVCDMVALCGARKVVGIDVMDTVGCGFPHERIDYRVMDICRMNFSDQSFDLVYSIATFEHLPEPYEALLELLRVTKIGGYGYVQAGPLYHSPFGHHMFEYFQDYPWIHLRKSRDAIIAYAKERGIDKRIEKNLGMPCEQYVAGMLNVDHVNGLLLDNYKLNEFRKRNDVEILKFNISYEGRELLTPEIAAEIRGIAADKLVEHGFEIAFRRSR